MVLRDYFFCPKIKENNKYCRIIINMNWYKKIIMSKDWSIDKKRRMPETPEEIYQYYHSDDDIPSGRAEIENNYPENRMTVMGKPPDEMSPDERQSILSPEPDGTTYDPKIYKMLKLIRLKEGDVNKILISKYKNIFPNVPLSYILNYAKEKGFMNIL